MNPKASLPPGPASLAGAIGIPLSRPFSTGREDLYVREVALSGRIASNGKYTLACEDLIRQHTGAANVMLTHSCTAALEVAALLTGVTAGDEIIMPSFTFPSTANAFLLRGARPVFVDIRADTLNIDETRIEAAITPRTKAIVVVHYAGIPCAMDSIMEIADRHGLYVIEDAAHAYLSSHQGKSAGTIGHLGTFSFHSTKNISCGEGGALLINDARLAERAEILRNKGTNRKDFLAGKVRKYCWVGLGTSPGMSELTAAYLCAQLEKAADITSMRLSHWQAYDDGLKTRARQLMITTPFLPPTASHNAHIYYVLLSSEKARENVLRALADAGIEAATHYEPLHLAPMGEACLAPVPLPNSTTLPLRLLRLPLWPDLPAAAIEQTVDLIAEAALSSASIAHQDIQ